MMRHYRIVKKFSNMFEARMAQEMLTLYHVKTVITKNYLIAHAQFEQTMQEVYLLTLPHDYQLAHRLLCS